MWSRSGAKALDKPLNSSPAPTWQRCIGTLLRDPKFPSPSFKTKDKIKTFETNRSHKNSSPADLPKKVIQAKGK